MPETSRDQAVVAAVRKFDGFEVREDWDPYARIEATLEAAGYEPLIELILDAAAEAGHIHYTGNCPTSPRQRWCASYRGRWHALRRNQRPDHGWYVQTVCGAPQHVSYRLATGVREPSCTDCREVLCLDQ